MSTMIEWIGNHGMSMPLSIEKVAYSIVQQDLANPDLTPTQELDPILQPIWAQGPPTTINYLDLLLPSFKTIIEALVGLDRP